MKKPTMLVSALIGFGLMLIHCAPKPEELKLADLKTACDYVDALESLADEVIRIQGDRPKEKWTEEEKGRIKLLQKKAREVGEAADKKYTEAEFRECPNFGDLEKKVEESNLF